MNTQTQAKDGPCIVNYGMGVDSTAMLVGLRARGIRPDLILFADTGSEKDATYAYLDVINAWCARAGFPSVTVVRYRPVRAKYTTLEENCLANETLPSIAFRGGGPGTGGCSLKWKASVMRMFIKGSKRGPWKGEGWAPFWEAKRAGLKTIRFVGYDDDSTDRSRSERGTRIDADDFLFIYPLQSWGWTRERCEEEILAAGLPLPPKSACFFCPASKKHEIAQLAISEPDKFRRAIALEDRAAAGKHGLGEKRGLGIRFRWRAFAEEAGFLRWDGSIDADRAAVVAVNEKAKSLAKSLVKIQRRQAQKAEAA